MAQPEEVKYSHIQVSKFLGFQPLSPGLPSLGFSPIWPAPQRRSVDTSNSPLRLLFPAVACKVGKGCITTKNPTVSWGRSGGNAIGYKNFPQDYFSRARTSFMRRMASVMFASEVA